MNGRHEFMNTTQFYWHGKGAILPAMGKRTPSKHKALAGAGFEGVGAARLTLG